MPSKKYTKANIDKEVQNNIVAPIAAMRGISATSMLEQMILFWIIHNGDSQTP
jgi:hypothetical protein